MIIAVDASLAQTGWAVMTDEGEVVKHGIIKTSPRSKFQTRLNKIYDTIDELILHYNPTGMPIEDGFVGPNKRTSVQLATIRGMVYGLGKSYGLDMALYQPATPKKFMTGKGNSSKKKVAEAVFEKLPDLDRNITNDETDAISIGLTYLGSE